MALNARLLASGFGLGLALLASTPAWAATISVTTTADNDLADADCSLREAIVAANDDVAYNGCPAGAGADRIAFSLSLPATIALASDLPAVTTTLLIQGPGADLLTLDGQGSHRILMVDSASGGAWLGVEELILAHGFADKGGGTSVLVGDSALFRRVVFLENHASNGGGGLYVLGDLAASSVRVEECWFAGNVAEGGSGGGGVFATGILAGLEIDRTTFSGNASTGSAGVGGGIRLADGTLTLRRSTLAGNRANSSGGGIHVGSYAADAGVTLRDSTITENVADADLDGNGDGGGFKFAPSAGRGAIFDLTNSIVAGNVDAGFQLGPDIFADAGISLTLSSGGFNFIGTNEGATTFFVAGLPNADGDWIGTAAAPIDPELDPLGAYGGFAPTHRPTAGAGSPIIDQGSCTGSGSDQRGHGDAVAHVRIVDRPAANADDGCDIGAFERGGDAGAEPLLFVDGFEDGHALHWSSESP